MNDKVQKALEARKKKKDEVKSSYEKSKSKVDAALAARKERITSNIDSIMDDINKRYESVVSSFNDSISTSLWGKSSADIYAGQRERMLEANKLLRDVEAYSSYLGKDKADSVLKSLKEIKQGYDSIYSSAPIYSQFKSEDEYKEYRFRSDSDNADGRQKRYEENQKKIAELEEQLKAHRNTNNNLTYSYGYSNGTFTQNAAQDKKEIQKQLDALKAENRQYELGEGHFTSKTVDDYSKISKNADFQAVAANRSYTNPTQEEIAKVDAMNDSSTWKFDANGIYCDAFGNELAVDDAGIWYNPEAQSTQVKDKLALYLSTSEDERVQASMETQGIDGIWTSVMKEGYGGGWEYLNEEEIGIYYYLLNENQESAYKYLADMETELNRRRTLEQNEKWNAAYDEANLLEKIALNAATVPSKFVSNLSGTIDNAINTLQGDDINPYSIAHGGMHFSQTIRGATSEELDEASSFKIPFINFTLGDIYQTGMSRLDSVLATTIFGGGSTVFLGMGAAQDEAYRLYQQGASPEQITLGSLAAGAAEAVFEYASFDKLINMGDTKTLRQFIKNTLIQGGIEASEEAFTEISNIITNAVIMGQQSDLAKLLEENGGSEWKTFLGLVQQTMGAAFGGFIGGMGAGGVASAKTYVGNQLQYRRDGKSINYADGGLDALKALANEVSGASGADMQAEIAKKVSKVDSKASHRNVGKLYDTVQTANKVANSSANQADIAKSLERKGFNTETANDIAAALVASYNGQTLTKAQSKLLESVQNSQVVKDAISNIVGNVKSTMGQRNQNIRDFQADIHSGVVSKAIYDATGVDLTGKNTAAEEFTPKGEYNVSDNTKAFRTDTQEDIDIKGVASISNGEVLLDIGDGKTINSKDVTYASKQDALIYEAIANLGDKVNAKAANDLFSLYDGKNAALFARGIAQAYSFGFNQYDKAELASKSSFASDLTEEQRNAAYNLGKEYRSVKDQADKDNAHTTNTPAEKGVYYRGKDGNATDISTYLKSSNVKLNERQKTAVEAMRKFSETMGARFNVFETWKENGKTYYLNEYGVKTEGNPNGFYDTRTGEIYISLDAGAVSKNGFRDTMLFTIAHEMTHFMKQWSPEHFTKISKIVFAQAGFKGHVSELVAAKMEARKKSGKPISYDTAVEEVVADAMETILKDGKVVEFMAEVKQKDQTAWQKLKGWFKNLEKFLRKLVVAYRGEHANTTEGDIVANFAEDTIRQIQQIWAEGAVAAGDSYQGAETQKNTTGDGGGKTLFEVRETFASELREWFENTSQEERKVSGKRFTVGTTSNVLKSIGVKEYSIYMGGSKINKILESNASMSLDTIADAVMLLDSPILVMKSLTVEDSIVLFGEVFTSGNKPVMISLLLSPKTKSGEILDYAVVTSAYGRTNNNLQNMINKAKIYYVNEQKNRTDEWLKALGLQLPSAITKYGPIDTIEYSEPVVKNESSKALDIEVDQNTESVAPSHLASERTWSESDYVKEREQAAKEISKAIGVSVKKAKAYIDSVNSIAKMIAEDRVRLDYFSSPGRSSFVSNVEYGGSFDFSTLCKKRRLLTGTFTAIQKALPNTALTADEILKIRNKMKNAGLEVSCGLCYVEGSRANMGQFAKEFLRLYKQYYPDAWQPNMADVNTPDGIEWVRINHPECYEQYEYFWNHYGTLKAGDKNLFASQQKPKLYQLHTEYKGEILDKFDDDDNVEEKNLNGGIRLQSFSDFEIVHLIDTMQIVMDMSRVGLAGQAYTKVPDFAWALGDTGLKINLSLIAKGVDENGKLIFDDVEGMPIDTAVSLRNRYSKNVGTILVAFNDEQLLAAMADDRVDFIIPFHRSQWKKSQYEAMGLPAKTKDYTYMQNEKFIKPQYHKYRDRMVKDKATNYMPNEYWDFSKSGKENAEAYLEMCAKNNKRPKFYKLLQNNGDGSYSLKADGSTDGYWKLLIDFKMYDNDGVGSPQMPVKPDFNMEEATRMLDEYKGGHSNFPVAQGIVDEFVQEYKDSHKGSKFSMRESVEETADLLAYHNITAKQLQDVLNRNGLLMPSLAITNKGMTDFGEISLLFDKSTIDPSVDSQNKLYGADAWTPQQNELKKNAKFDTDKTVRTVNTIKNRIGSKFVSDLFNVNPKQFRDAIIKADGNIFDAYAHNIGMQTAYAMEQGIISKIPTKNGSVDRAALQAQLNSELDTDNGWRLYRKWLRNISDTIITSYDTATNEDILNSMKSQPATAKPFKLTMNGELVVPVAEYADIDTMRKNKGRLSENAAEATKAVADEFLSFAKRIGGNTSAVVDAINAAFGNRYSTADIVKSFNGKGIKISAQTASELQSLYKKAVELPTQYFEAKPGREVGLDEIKAVVMPKNSPSELRQNLENRGIKVVEYDGSKESRVEALNSVEDIKFSDRDTDGNQLSEDQQEFFAESKARDENGNLYVMYHGSRSPLFTEFDMYEGVWLTPDQRYAEVYAEMWHTWRDDDQDLTGLEQSVYADPDYRLYNMYANITNPLDLGEINDEFDRSQMNRLARLLGVPTSRIRNISHHDGYQTVGFVYEVTKDHQFIEIAKEKGYDGFIASEKGRKTFCAFNAPNQVKLTTNEVPSGFYDIRYQDRAEDSVSNRSMLANAFESAAQNDIERNKIQEYKSKISLIEAEEKKLSQLNAQIKELSFAKGHRDTQKIRDLQFEARQTSNRINTYDKQLLRLEASKPLQDVLQREKKIAYQRAEKKGKEALEAYREKTMKTQRELLEKWQESRKKGIDSRNRTAMRHKIKDVVNELNQYLLRGTKDRHVPIELQKAVAEALDAVNMDTVGAEERIAKLKDELLKAKTPEQIQEISRKIDHIQEMGDRMNGRLKKLKDAYDQFVNSDDPLVANSHDEVISNKLQSVIETVGDTPLRDMTLAQLEDVYDMYRMVLTTIRNTNKAFKAKKNESISTLANQVMMEVAKVGGKKKLTMKGMDGIKSFAWNNLKPVYAFEHIGSGTFTNVFNSVRAGEDVWAVDVTEAREFYLDKSKKHNYDSWDFQKMFKFTSSSGMDFELNLEQIMSLYAYSKRDQAADHLKKGGIVIDETTEITIKTKLGIPVKFNPTEATAYNISDETLADIISKLSDEQKNFVDEMQEYLSTVMGAKGNEVSLEMYGVKLFKEKFYFPLKSAQQFMVKAKEQAQGEVKIKNSGFSKETVQKASNPIVLTPFMNVWANHVNEMSMYHAFVLPMEDFYRVYNYRTPTSDTMATESVEMFIQNAYGKGATGYIDQLLKDLNGGARTDTRTGFINTMMGRFKKGAVFASLSVVIQQPSAIARAAALVDTKYFIGPKVDHKRHKALWNEVKQYAPVAIIKEMGYFDTNMGKSTQDFITSKEYSGFKEKMTALVKDSGYRDEVLSKAPALADELAWCGIWEAVKRETKAKYPGLDVKGEPFLKLAGSRFTEVITKTQVYDSVLSRSGLMRSKDTGLKMATAFMAEPTTSINMIADALLQGKRGNKKYTRAAIGAVIASQILNSILVSFVYAGRDDDEDETYLEKYIGTLTGEALDSLNPATYIPFIKDIVSIVKGYEVERSDMAVYSDLVSAWQKLSKDNVSVYRKVEGFVGSIAQIFGLPVKNIMRDVRGIYQTIDSFVNGQLTTAAGIGYAVKSSLPKWIGGGDVSNKDQLYEAYISGDEAQLARVVSRYKDESAANTAMRSAIKERYEAGEISSDIASEYLVEYTGMEEENAYWKLQEWAYESNSEEEYGKYNKFYEAVQTGKNIKAVIKEYTDNGVELSTLKSSITSHFRPLYIEMSNSEKASIKGYLLNAYELCGYDRAEAADLIAEWEYESNHPELVGKIKYSQYKRWETDGKPNGVSIDLFTKVSEYRDDGTSGSAKSQEEVAAYINSLSISTAQKDALWCCFWKESTLKNAPWH